MYRSQFIVCFKYIVTGLNVVIHYKCMLFVALGGLFNQLNPFASLFDQR